MIRETVVSKLDPIQAQEGMPVEKMANIIQHSPPGPWPHKWATWGNTQEAHRMLAEDFANDLLAGPPGDPGEGRGIVIGGGGLRYFPSVWVNINLLRHFGCELPIQLWYLGCDECDPYLKRLLEPFGVEFMDAREVEKEHPCRILCGWELKPFATLYSRFADVLFLDADNGVCMDPTYLFEDDHYKEYGAVFWPDYSCWVIKHDVWGIFGIDRLDNLAAARAERPFESGQYLINKQTRWKELRMTLWYAEHSDFVFEHVYGDKECYHLGWLRLGTEYAMPPRDPGWDVHTICQFDFDNRIVFQHRCQDKWHFGTNKRNDSLRNEQMCFDLVQDLSTKWDGVPWSNPDPTPSEQRMIDSLVGRTYMYRRVDHDEREITLLEDDMIGRGSGECERKWSVLDDDGVLVLTISKYDKPTCHLRLCGDGVWRGQWIEYEKMPIELQEVEI